VTAKGHEITIKDVAGGSYPDPTQKLLLTAALGEGQDALNAWRRWLAAGNLDRMDGGSFRLLPLLHSNLQRLGVRGPEVTLLKGIRRRAWYQNQMLLRELMPLVGEWTRRGISVTVLKGAALGPLHYGDLSLRPMNDLDILVPHQHVAAIMAELTNAGWKRWTWAPTPLTSAYMRFRHAIAIQAPSGPEIDLHWHILYTCCNDDIDEQFLRRSVRVELMGVTVNALDPTGQLIHTCLHGMIPLTAETIRWIADVVMIMRSAPIDWDRVVAFATATGQTVLLRTALAYLNSDFNCEIPSQVTARLDAAKIGPAERAEASRLLYPDEDLSIVDTVRGEFRRYRRSAEGPIPIRYAGWLRHIQYKWKSDSVLSTATPLLKWIRCRTS
jgi:hypothetical protein